jgi:pilus assembly protein CpaE
VVDLEDCFHDEQVVALHQATGVLLICRLDFASLRNARRVLDHLGKLDIQRDRLRLVVNQHGQPHHLPVDEAEDALGEKFAYFVPYDPKIISASNNTGIPVVLKDPHSKVATSLTQLAKMNFKKRGSSAVLPKLVLR